MMMCDLLAAHARTEACGVRRRTDDERVKRQNENAILL
jgi:hypothetical protein